ncbi:MAG: hypothetical protein JJV98_00605 [Desulfosarcina sp.]|nr:hypothetical protein [Desulfobacterales bacterium]
MDRIDNMTFKSGSEMGLWYEQDELKQIKKTISRKLKIGHERLNEIALEDIEIERNFQHRIYDTLYDLVVVAEISGHARFSGGAGPGVPCTGFWIEGSRDLILYAWNDYQSQTILIPQSDWFLRDDITLH